MKVPAHAPAALALGVAITASIGVRLCIDRIEQLRGTLAEQRDAIAIAVTAHDRLAAHDADDRAELAACRARTESLHHVLEVLIPSGIWPERVRLPDPPPGWKPWPALGHRDRAESLDDVDERPTAQARSVP